MRIGLAAAAAMALLALPARAEAPPDWLSGYWLSCENGVQTAESWVGAGAGLLIGANLSRRAGRAAQFEWMRIGPSSAGEEASLSFYGSPSGAPPVEFAMVSHADRRAVFENPAHDFPQRVIYARDGNQLTARVEGGDGQALEWRFRRARQDAACAFLR
ncbi:MAG: DUF6265 family protein [Hyphomonadaceae bacterium]